MSMGLLSKTGTVTGLTILAALAASGVQAEENTRRQIEEVIVTA